AVVATGALLAACGGDDGGDGDAAADPAGAGGPALRVEVVAVGEAGEGLEGVQAFRIESAEHTRADIEYSVNPAPGGPHHPVWANCGFYDAPLPEEHLVHDLEHGAVWLAYPPDLPAGDVATIRALATSQDKVVAAPFDGLADGEAVVA